MIFAALLLMVQSAPPPPPPIALPNAPIVERLGPGPHTLVISDGKAMTRIDYKTGPACQFARDETRRQVPSSLSAHYGISNVKAFCVPR